jgi:hypothetical protein
MIGGAQGPEPGAGCRFGIPCPPLVGPVLPPPAPAAPPPAGTSSGLIPSDEGAGGVAFGSLPGLLPSFRSQDASKTAAIATPVWNDWCAFMGVSVSKLRTPFRSPLFGS